METPGKFSSSDSSSAPGRILRDRRAIAAEGEHGNVWGLLQVLSSLAGCQRTPKISPKVLDMKQVDQAPRNQR